MTFRKKIIMVSNNRFDNQNEYSISDITNKISTLEGKINSGDSGSNAEVISQISSNLETAIDTQITQKAVLVNDHTITIG